MIKIANKNASNSVNNKIEFKGNNTFAIWNLDKDVYKVYSYGFHFPIYAYKDGKWYENIDKYSNTTCKHQSQLKPCENCIPLNTQQIKDI